MFKQTIGFDKTIGPAAEPKAEAFFILKITGDRKS